MGAVKVDSITQQYSCLHNSSLSWCKG